MPDQDQLEIIDPQGRIRFYPLDPAKGLTNIGRHIDNDIIINRPGVAAFHAMLDHRAKPYHLVVLAQREKTVLDGEPAPINIPTPLNNWAALEIGGHQIIYLAGDEPPTPEPLAALPEATEAPAPPPPAEIASPSQPSDSTTTRPLDSSTTRLPDLSVEYSARTLAIDPGQTATLEVTIINGGYKPLSFAVTLEGLDPAWVTITPPELEVPARQRSPVSVAIAPPRQPGSAAGTQNAAVTVAVTTENFPEWKNQLRLPVTLNPYADFALSELLPRVQTLPGGKPFALASFAVTNRGNAEAAFRLTGEDERYALRYEFKFPNDPLSQPRQAELRLAPGETRSVEVHATPMTRYRLGLSNRQHFFTITVAPQNSPLLPRSVLGEVRERPRFGPLPIALCLSALLLLGVLLFMPRISRFTVDPPSDPARADQAKIVAGQSVTLAWSASPVANLRITPDIGAVPGPDGRWTVTPTKDTIYTLIAENFLSWINPNWFRATRRVTVLVDPVLPGILLFTTDRDTVQAGESITLAWNVSNADELALNVNGIPQSIPASEHLGSRGFQLTQDTVFTLQARNDFTTAEGVTATINIRVIPDAAVPAPTEPARPVVDRFEVSPGEITAGQQVTIYWAVSGVDKVFIDPLPGEFPPSGNLTVSPQQTTAYVLTAASGDTPVKLVKQVIVNPSPGAPRIESFTAAPNEVAPGSSESQNIKLAWLVADEATDIQLAGPGLGPATNLSQQGEIIVIVTATSTFTLTAFNGELSSTQTVEVKVVSPAPTLLSLAPSSATAGGAPFTLSVTGANFVNGSVVQWNGSPRSTTYNGPAQLLAAVAAADVANAGAANVTVFNPAPGGGTSSAVSFTINNPAPLISGLSPNSTTAGGPAFVLTINGSGFNIQTLVRWNGSQRAVSSVTTTQLMVVIPASDVTASGSATVSVVNPVPGGGSDASVFTLTAPTATPTATLTPTPTVTPTATPP